MNGNEQGRMMLRLAAPLQVIILLIVVVMVTEKTVMGKVILLMVSIYVIRDDT